MGMLDVKAALNDAEHCVELFGDEVHATCIREVAVDSSGTRFASGGADPNIKISAFDGVRRVTSFEVPSHGDHVGSIRWNSSGALAL